MSNMSYCRFRNTLEDLRDCINNFEDNELSEEEAQARYQMVSSIVHLVERYNLLEDESYVESFNPDSESYQFGSDEYYEEEDDD